MKKIKINLFNYSDVYGGQEKYISLLLLLLKEKKYYFSFEGGPDELMVGAHLNAESYEDIFVFNGNKALYKNFYRFNRRPSIYIQHSDIEDDQGPLYKRLIRKFLLYFCLKKVDAVIRVCNKCLPGKYAKGKVSTVYNGVELKSEDAKKLNIDLNLLMVGAINNNKNQALAIKALPYLDDVTLTIVGTGADSEALKLMAIELGVCNRVRWAGFHKDPTLYYEQADLLLMLSKNEAFPFVVLEAMAHGIPIVGVPVGGVPEAVQHMNNGILLNDYRPESLAKAIKSIQEDGELYTELSNNALESIRNKFSLDKMTEGFLNVVNKVIEKRGLR